MSFGRLSSSARAHSSHRARLRGVAALGAPLLLATALAGCGGSSDAENTDEPTDSSGTAGLVSLNQEWPLTGEALDGDAPDHPVYVVKIDNTSSSAPQIG